MPFARERHASKKKKLFQNASASPVWDLWWSRRLRRARLAEERPRVRIISELAWSSRSSKNRRICSRVDWKPAGNSAILSDRNQASSSLEKKTNKLLIWPVSRLRRLRARIKVLQSRAATAFK